MVMYDVTNEQSFGSCSKWLERVKAKKVTPESPLPGTPTFPLLAMQLHVLHALPYLLSVKESLATLFSTHTGVLVANKVDLKERRLVGEEEGRKFAASKDLEYFECSAVSFVVSQIKRVALFLLDVFLSYYDLQKESDNVEKPFLYLAEQFYQTYSDKVDMET